MARRILAVLGTLVLAVVLLAAPAQAEQVTQTCAHWYGNVTQTRYDLCISTYWTNDAGATGITVHEIDVDLGGGPWESLAFNCDAIRMWNQDDVVKFRRDGNVCDMTKSWPHLGFQPGFPDGLDMPATNTVSVSIAGWPKFNNNADPGRIVFTQNIHD